MPPISGHGAPAVVNIKFSDGNLETQKAWSSYLQAFAYFGGRAVYLGLPSLAQLSAPVIGERLPATPALFTDRTRDLVTTDSRQS
jgi:hypothetical protein